MKGNRILMNRAVLFFLTFALGSILPAKASAQAYEPGTIGYVYESCMASLRESESAEEFEKSYCGYFIAGTMVGLLHSNYILLTEPEETDPCKQAKNKEYDRINSRWCKNIEEKLEGDKPETHFIILKEWGDFLKLEGKAENIFVLPVTMAWRYSQINGKSFCTYVDEMKAEDLGKEVINPDVLKGFVKNFDTGTTTLMAEYESCRNDIRMAAGNSQKFAETKCGAEILGFIAGLFSTEHLQYNRGEVIPSCKKEIDDLYENLDVTARSCIKENTSPLWLAGLFVQSVDELRKAAEEEGRSWGRGEKTPRGIVMGTLFTFGKICKTPEPPPTRPFNE